MENVVLFPRTRENVPPQTIEDIVLKIRENKEMFANEVADDLMSVIIHEIRMAGYSFDEGNLPLLASVHMVYEAILSVLLHMSGTEHHLQQAAVDLYLDEDEEEKVDSEEK